MDMACVSFTMLYSGIRHGESVYLVGDHELLGKWVAALPLTCDADTFPVWTSEEVDLPCDSPISFRFLIMRANGKVVRSESRFLNRVLELSPGMSINVRCTWESNEVDVTTMSPPMSVDQSTRGLTEDGAKSSERVSVGSASCDGSAREFGETPNLQPALPARMPMRSIASLISLPIERVRDLSKDVAFEVASIVTATSPATRSVVASATGGALCLGTGGAAAGFVTGGAIGATAGMVPAIFTCGLTVPLFATLGSGCGAALGSFLGGATGLVGGAAVGYGAFQHREAIQDKVDEAVARLEDATMYLKEMRFFPGKEGFPRSMDPALFHMAGA